MVVGHEKKKSKNVDSSADHQNFQGHPTTYSLESGGQNLGTTLPYRIVMNLPAGEYADHLLQACASMSYRNEAPPLFCGSLTEQNQRCRNLFAGHPDEVKCVGSDLEGLSHHPTIRGLTPPVRVH